MFHVISVCRSALKKINKLHIKCRLCEIKIIFLAWHLVYTTNIKLCWNLPISFGDETCINVISLLCIHFMHSEPRTHAKELLLCPLLIQYYKQKTQYFPSCTLPPETDAEAAVIMQHWTIKVWRLSIINLERNKPISTLTQNKYNSIVSVPCHLRPKHMLLSRFKQLQRHVG